MRDRPSRLTSARQLPPAALDSILRVARELRRHPAAAADLLAGKRVALCFFEPSTRTRLSFALACEYLGARWLDAGDHSAILKGESLGEMCNTLRALGFDALVLRHTAEGAAEIASTAIPTINAGDGVGEHPTQALADCLALEDAIGDLGGVRICLVGDILHSRVARSARIAFAARGAQVRVAGPRALCAAVEDPDQVLVTREEALAWAQVIYVLRPQRERGAFDVMREGDYVRDWRIGDAHLDDDQVLLHAGPLLPGLDLAAGLVGDPRLLARDQVAWGPWARAAALAWLLADA